MQINDPNKASFGAIGGILAAVAAIVIAIIWIMPKAKEIRSKHSQAATVQANIASLQATDAQLHQATKPIWITRLTSRTWSWHCLPA